MRVLTYNVKLLPRFAKRFEAPFGIPRGWWESMRTDELRVRLLCEVLLRENVDVIALQEAFDEGHRIFLKNELTAAGYEVHTPDIRSLRAHHGLLLASRCGLKNCGFEAFAAHALPDSVCKKGFLWAEVNACGKRVLVVTAHLQAETSGRPIRRRQLQQFVRTVSKELAHRRVDSLILLGDFNIIGEDDDCVETSEYVELLRALGEPCDVFRELSTVSEPWQDLVLDSGSGRLSLPGEAHRVGATWDGRGDALTPRNPMVPIRDRTCERLDYVFSFSKFPSPSGKGPIAEELPLQSLEPVSAEVLRFELESIPLSDHFAVSATFK